MIKNPFFDEDFLNRLTLHRQREVYARVTALTKDELPIEFIQGKVIGGSVNIDGTSAVRRTCSLSMVAKEVNINDFYWGLKNKFKLEIGLKNNIDSRYPDIIWFKQGLFIITSFSTSLTTNNYTINISGKDKMCLLNGDLSGALPHSTDFGIEEIVDTKTGITTYRSIPIKDIIREAVQSFGGELAHNIIINDLEDAGLMLMEYKGNSPLYMLYDIEKGVFTNVRMNGSDECYVYNTSLQAYEGPYRLDNNENIVYDNLADLITTFPSIIKFSLNEGAKEYRVARIEYGMMPGYKLTDLTYAGDLIANVGESLTSVLDKIKNMLGDYEYFYDIEGRFIFRKRPIYVTSPWNSSETDNEIYVDAVMNTQNKIFNLTNGHLITSFSNTPNLLNLRNDFSVWGKYKSISGAELPIHMRYAIDKKPTSYLPFRPVKQIIKTTVEENGVRTEHDPEIKYFNAPYLKPYNDDDFIIVAEEPIQVSNTTTQEITNYYIKNPLTSDDFDWRELIYQMALDFRKFSHDDDFIFKLRQANPQYGYGKTGYESYYTDIEGFWRDLYNPDPELQYALIGYSEASQTDKLFVSGFRKVTQEEKENINLDNIGSYYVLSSAIEIIDEVETPTSVALYPFKKGYCKLNNDTTYYFMTSENQLNQGTQDKDLLNGVNIDLIYTLFENKDGEKEYLNFVETKMKEALDEDVLYIMEEKMQISEMDDAIKSLLESYPEVLTYKDTDNFGYVTDKADYIIKLFYYSGFYDFYTVNDEAPYWRRDTIENPESLIFWFDFLDAEGTDFGKYSVSAIGTRSKAINDNDVKSIYYRDIPTTIFLGQDDDKYEPKTGYTYVQLPYYMDNLFTVSSKGKSAKERIDELLYDHLFCTESANISIIPVYHLEPNGKIYIQDEDSGINGEYVISKITLPLTYNGTMTLTATKTTPSDMLIF